MFHLVITGIRWILILASLIAFLGCASRQKELNTTILQTAKSLSTLYKEPKRPWPEFNLTDYPILFVSLDQQMVKRLVKNKLQELRFETWRKKIPHTDIDFDTLTIDGQRYLVLHLDRFEELSSVKLMTTAIHEGFHLFGQSEWTQQKKEDGRGNIYPVQAIPRYYRWEMKNHLIEFFRTKDPVQLRHYSYWYYKWKKNFNDEYHNYTDRIEGTAQYYTNQMITISRNLGSKTKVTPLAVFESNKATNQPFRKMFSLSYESYVLGTLSGILLDEISGVSWQKTVKLDPSPLELLARRYQPLRDEINHQEQNQFMAASLEEMEKIDSDGRLDKIISDLSSATFAKVAINSKGLEFSSFATKGIYRSFFNFKGIKEVQMIKLASNHEIRSKEFLLKYQKNDYWVTSSETPCGQDHSTLLTLKKDEIKFENGILKTGSAVTKRLPATFLKFENHDWYCVNFKRDQSI